MRSYSPPDSMEPPTASAMLEKAQQAEWVEDFATAWRWLDPVTQMIPCPAPTADLWDGQPLTARDVLYVWKRFRDIGADIRHASMLADLDRLPQARIVVETDPRLIPLFKRSFPRLEYVPREPEARPTRVATYQATHERLGLIFRSRTSDFPSHCGFLTPDPDRVSSAAALRPRDGRRLVGFSWASTNSDKSLPTLEDWLPVLRSSDASFVSLQYGDVDHDINYLRRQGIDIVAPPGLDTRNDFDGLAAVIATCDSIFTISNTTAHLAGAVGTPTTVVLRDQPMLIWPRCQSRTAWYPNVRLAWCPAAMSWHTWMMTYGTDFQRLTRAA